MYILFQGTWSTELVVFPIETGNSPISSYYYVFCSSDDPSIHIISFCDDSCHICVSFINQQSDIPSGRPWIFPFNDISLVYDWIYHRYVSFPEAQ